MTQTQTAPSTVKTFKSFDGSTIEVLDNGQAIRRGVTGRMLLTEVGGQFICYLDTYEVWQAECVALAEQIGAES